MNNVKKETLELLAMMPDAATPYGSGYFVQNDSAGEKKSMDIILSVDNPNEWHRENLEYNPWMYKGSSVHNLVNNGLLDCETYFPQSLGCFFTNFEGREYKIVVVDKQLLYDHLCTWEHFSLTGRFQKPMALIIDNSKGLLPFLMKQNYRNAVKVGLLMNPGEVLSVNTLFETITSLSYLGDLRNIFHFEDPNKIHNIVNGSYDFFEQTYGGHDSEYKREVDLLFKSDDYNGEELFGKISTLPSSVKNYLISNLSYDELMDTNLVALELHKYFRKIDFIDSIKMALRCNQTVGFEKVTQTLSGKFKKGRQKIKRKAYDF